MINYLNKIDALTDCIIDEYNSKHEPVTKMINYEYYCGKLHQLFELAQEETTTADFVFYYEYRKEDRDRIAKLINDSIITPIYKATRAAI